MGDEEPHFWVVMAKTRIWVEKGERYEELLSIRKFHKSSRIKTKRDNEILDAKIRIFRHTIASSERHSNKDRPSVFAELYIRAVILHILIDLYLSITWYNFINLDEKERIYLELIEIIRSEQPAQLPTQYASLLLQTV